VPDHLRATGLDHVEPVAAITLLEDHLPGRELGMLEPGAELFDRRRRQRAEQGDRPKDLDVYLPKRCRRQGRQNEVDDMQIQTGKLPMSSRG